MTHGAVFTEERKTLFEKINLLLIRQKYPSSSFNLLNFLSLLSTTSVAALFSFFFPLFFFFFLLLVSLLLS